MPPNVKSSWNIFDKEMNRIFNFDIWHWTKPRLYKYS
jgi:hypothetical protein